MSDLPSPPFIKVEGIHNFRDAGGYALATPGTSVRRGLIYRCADPSSVTAAGQQVMRDLGITTVFDLRSKPELERASSRGPVAKLQGIDHQFVPAFAEVDYSPEKIAVRFKDYAHGGPEGFRRAYDDILSHAMDSFRTILLHVRDHPDQPFVVHCTAGKDRTGVIVALILSIAGVSNEQIAQEYELTEGGLAAWRPVIVEHLSKEPALANDQEAIARMISARSENMLATLKMLREKYGGAEEYLKSSCALSDADIKTIRRNLVVDQPAVL